jgi:HPt (histidine-containing phosphotransfer) domain-containing protein
LAQKRIAVIQRAVAALADEHLDSDLRREAESEAHMLAGSMGMFGFMQASVAARRVEWELAHLGPASERMLVVLLASIRSDVQHPVGGLGSEE